MFYEIAVKKIALLALVCAFAEAQTIVQQRLVDASGKPQTAYVTITWPNFTTAGGIAVSAGSLSRTVTNGQLIVPLYPTVGANPSTATYTVTVVTGSVTSNEIWDVPQSAVPVTRNAVLVTLGGPVKTMYVGDLSSVATDGQAIFWNNSLQSWQPQPVSYEVSGTWLSYSTGTVSASTGTATITGAGATWTSDMAGRWLMVSGMTKQYKVSAVDAVNQVLTTYDNLDTDIVAGSAYSLTQPILVTAATHGLNSTSIDATCKNSDSSVNQDILVATIVKVGGDVEVVLYGAFTGSCTLRR